MIMGVEEVSRRAVFFKDLEDGCLLINTHSEKQCTITPPNISLHLTREACKDLLEMLKRIEKRSKKNGQ